MAKRSRAIEQVITSYHKALEKKDPQGAMAYLSSQYFTMGPGPAEDPHRWGIGRMPKALWKKWFKEASYKNKLAFLHSEINGDLAIAVASESGKITMPDGEGHKWDGAVNVWCLAKVKGSWKITSSVHGISGGK